jgi:integrase
MMHYNELVPAQASALVPHADRLRFAVAAYLARFKGTSRDHADSDLRCYLAWCDERGLDPLLARRPHLELYIRWMQEVRQFKPSTVSRRFSVTAGFYRTCVIDGVLEHSPAEHVRRPAVPAESPTPPPQRHAATGTTNDQLDNDHPHNAASGARFLSFVATRSSRSVSWIQ